MSDDQDNGGSWTLPTGHEPVLVESARNPDARTRDISPAVGLTAPSRPSWPTWRLPSTSPTNGLEGAPAERAGRRRRIPPADDPATGARLADHVGVASGPSGAQVTVVFALPGTFLDRATGR